MRSQTLEEFAEELRRKGDYRETEFADEILMLLDVEEEFAEPYSALCLDISFLVPNELEDNPAKSVEWLGERSNLLEEIEKELEKDGRTDDPDDQVKALLETLAKIRDIIGVPDTATDEDIEDAIQALVDAAPPAMEYDL